MIKRFGDPDLIWELDNQECVFVYKWKRVQAFTVIGGGYDAAYGPIKSDEALRILFDKDQHVKRIGKDTKSFFESYGDFLRNWLNQNERD